MEQRGDVMTIDFRLLGKRIASARKKKGLTQERLAEHAELTNTYVSNIERGRSIPSLETLMKLCSALGCTPDTVLLGTNVGDKHYLEHDIQSRLALLGACDRRLVMGMIDLLLRERKPTR
jgi:transcriptional regulator with XRE-family HTH domain